MTVLSLASVAVRIVCHPPYFNPFIKSLAIKIIPMLDLGQTRPLLMRELQSAQLWVMNLMLPDASSI